MILINNLIDFDPYIQTHTQYIKKKLLFDSRVVVYAYKTLKSDIFKNPYMIECREYIDWKK